MFQFGRIGDGAGDFFGVAAVEDGAVFHRGMASGAGAADKARFVGAALQLYRMQGNGAVAAETVDAPFAQSRKEINVIGEGAAFATVECDAAVGCLATLRDLADQGVDAVVIAVGEALAGRMAGDNAAAEALVAAHRGLVVSAGFEVAHVAGEGGETRRQAAEVAARDATVKRGQGGVACGDAQRFDFVAAIPDGWIGACFARCECTLFVGIEGAVGGGIGWRGGAAGVVCRARAAVVRRVLGCCRGGGGRATGVGVRGRVVRDGGVATTATAGGENER